MFIANFDFVNATELLEYAIELLSSKRYIAAVPFTNTADIGKENVEFANSRTLLNEEHLF